MRPTTADRREARAERLALRVELRDPAPVMEAAAAFLAARPRSVEETRRRLRHHGYPAPLVDEVLVRLVELGYLDDRAFAEAWVESRDRARPRGAMALRRELALKGVDRETVEAVLAGRAERSSAPGPDDGTDGAPTASPDLDAGMCLLERRRAALDREPDPRRRRQKAYALLARNGFDPEVCREASTAFLAAAESLAAGAAAEGADEADEDSAEP